MEYHGRLLSVGRRWSLEDLETKLVTGEVQELRVTTVHDPPYMTIDPQPDGSYSYSGYLYDLWETIAKELNVRFRMVPLLSGDYGTLHENGTWSGMIGELAYGRADVALSSLDMRPDRATVVDYLDAYPVQSVTYKFYVRKQQEEIPLLSMDLFSALLKPLHVSVWWTLLASVLLLSVVLWISEGLDCTPVKKRKTRKDISLPSCLLSCFMAIVGQGWASTPGSLSARVATLSCWMLGIIITTSYTANMISHLTVTDVTSPITNLKDFLEQPEWMLAVTPGHASISDWKVSSNPYERELYRRTVTGQGFVPLDISSIESTKRSIHGKVMVYASFSSVTQILGDDSCAFMPVQNAPEKSADSFMAISKERKRLRRDINRLLLKMGDTGVAKGLLSRWVHPLDSMCETSSGFREVAFSDIFAVLLVMSFAMCVCLVIFGMERFLFKHGVIKKDLSWQLR